MPDDVLLRLAVSMRAHKRGGTLLVVPGEGRTGWRESIVRPDHLRGRASVHRAARARRTMRRRSDPRTRPALARVVDAVAGLTAVDGATLINDRYELLAFGVKIGRPEGRPRVEQVVVSEPVEGGSRGGGGSVQARRDAPHLGRAVRAGPAGQRGAGRVPGRALHHLRVVAREGAWCTPTAWSRCSPLSGGRPMRIAGLVGGIAPESTVEYYRLLIARYRERTGDPAATRR